MSIFPPVKPEPMKFILVSALSLPKTGKITKKAKFFLRASFRYKKGKKDTVMPYIAQPRYP